MQGFHYDVLADMRLPCGSLIRCSKKQSREHYRGLEAKGPHGWFKVVGEVILRQGESICLLEEPDRLTLQRLGAWEAWPDLLPSDLPVEEETYYAVRGLRLSSGTVLRLSREVLDENVASLKALEERWFELQASLWVNAGTRVQFKEAPPTYVENDLQAIRQEERESSVLSNGSPEPARIGLSWRQRCVLEVLDKGEELSIQSYHALCPDASRRTLQRDLEGMLARQLIEVVGKSVARCYRLAKRTA